jgi:hypothetical protein
MYYTSIEPKIFQFVWCWKPNTLPLSYHVCFHSQMKTMSFCAFCCSVLSGISNTGAYVTKMRMQSRIGWTFFIKHWQHIEFFCKCTFRVSNHMNINKVNVSLRHIKWFKVFPKYTKYEEIKKIIYPPWVLNQRTHCWQQCTLPLSYNSIYILK